MKVYSVSIKNEKKTWYSRISMRKKNPNLRKYSTI